MSGLHAHTTRRRLARLAVPALLLASAVAPAMGQEIVVKNDQYPDVFPPTGVSVGFQAYFNAGEENNVWLTAPCAGTIVAIDILWMTSGSGGAPITLENAITLYEPSTFPAHSDTPLANDFPAAGTPAELVGPAMQSGDGLYEFRFLDENNTVPLSVHVTQGQIFVLSFEFGEDHGNEGPPWGNVPTIPVDLDGCHAGKNGIFANGFGYLNWCTFSSGDFVMRVKMVCDSSNTGACCVNNSCTPSMTALQCAAAGGVYKGNGSSCRGTTCDGACCVAATQQCATVSAATCAAFNGAFQGPGTSCTTFVCFPMGACCLENGSCSAGPMSPAACAALGGTFRGNGSTCATACTPPTGACCNGNSCAGVFSQATCGALGGTWAGPGTTCSTPFVCPYCPADSNHTGSVDVNDMLAVITAWGNCVNCPADIHPPPFGNNVVNVNDLLLVITGWGVCH